MTFDELNLNKPLLNAVEDLGFINPTPVQEKTFSVIMSGKDVVGVAQTGPVKLLPIYCPFYVNLNIPNNDIRGF